MKNNHPIVVSRIVLRRILCLIILCSATLSVSSNNSLKYAQEISLTIRFENKSVQDVFNYIEKNSEFVFFYQKGAINTSRRVSLNLTNQPIATILSQLFAGTHVRYAINDRQIALKDEANIATPQQSRNVKGVVRDAAGEAVIGANVRVKGSTTGTITNIEGQFTLSVPSGKAILQVSFVGYKSMEVKLNNQNTVDIILEEDSEMLDEVVAIGYGRQKKSGMVSSVNTISNKEIAKPTRNLTNNLAGQIAGLIAVQRSGEPGYDDSSFWIRGVSSFKGGTDPLVLVDGVPRKMSDIEPDEIETFSLLKDAAATAVYGAEGANGVILITSRRGKEQKPRFTFRAEGSMLEPTRLPGFLGSKDFMDAYNEGLFNEGKQPLWSQEEINKYASHEDLDLYPDVQWMDLLKDHTYNQRYTLGIRGGTARARYFVSGAYYSEKGIFKSNGLEKYDTNIGVDRFNLRSNIDIDVSQTTLLNIDVSGQYLLTNYPGSGTSDIFAAMTRTAPNQIPMVYSDGTLAGHTEYNNGNRTNPYNMLMNSGYSNEWRTAIQSKVALEQKLDFITKGLSARGSISFDANMLTTVKRIKTPTLFHSTGRDENGQILFKEVRAGSDAFAEETKSTNDKQIYIEAQLNYHRVFGLHDVTGMMAYMQKEKSYHDKALPFRKQGFVGRLGYIYDSRYSLEANFGYTGSENFAEGYRFGFFPAVGAAWFVSQEKFYPDALRNVVNKLKFRASYGRTGNDAVNDERFIYRELLKQDGSQYNVGYRDGSALGDVGKSIWEKRFGAPYLSWEIEDKQNYGIDLGLFNNRIDIQVDYFNNKRHNILLQRETIPAVAGFQQSPWQNFGIVVNKGFDASVVLNHQIGDVKLSARGNYTFARNKVIERDEVTPKYPWMSATDIRLNSWNLLIAEGLYTEDDFIITGEGINRTYEFKDGVVTSGLSNDIRPGDIKYKDMNGDGIIDSNDRVQDVGQPSVPEIVYGFGLNVEYKGFYAGVFFQGSGNTSTVIGANAGQLIFPFSWGKEETSLRDVVMDRWSETNQSQDVMYPRLRTKSHAHNNTASTWWLRDASFIRLKNVELGYNVPKKTMKSFGLESMRIYLMGNNLAVWDKIKMWDPEIGNANEGSNYPLSRTYTVGLEISF